MVFYLQQFHTKSDVISYLVPFIIVFTSITGWYSLDYIGMNVFWGIFFLTSLAMLYLVFSSYKENISIKAFIKNKFNLVVLVYCLWLSISYLLNYQGKSSLLYIFKIWFMVAIYLIVLEFYFYNENEENKRRLLQRVTLSIFILGTFNSVIGIYQFITLSNKIFGITITEWPAYNPASMYGNVNGFGTYLFISIICGLYYFINNMQRRRDKIILFTIVFQCYMLYLTVARTSIVSLLAYVLFSFILFFLKDKKLIKAIFTKRNLIILLVSNMIMISIIKMPSYRGFINSLFHTQVKSERTAEDMLKEKNDKGLNYRDLIWKAVIRDYDEYITKGDGLKYNIIDKIDVVNVISERSKGVSRISYHNTLFRYFASNGLIGLIMFLCLYAYIPITLIIRMLKQKSINIKYSMVIILMTAIFMYMQMEEVYIGEIGFMAIITTIVLAYGGSLILKPKA